MTFISMNFSEVEEDKPVSPGFYSLRIDSCEVTATGPNSKHPGSPMLRVGINILDNDNAPMLSHFITFPNEGDDPGTVKIKSLNFKRFMQAFSLPINNDGIDLEQLAVQALGAEATCELTLSEVDDSGNIYNRLRLPKLTTEAKVKAPARRR